MDPFDELAPFVAAFGEWVEACWFAERDQAGARLGEVLAFPPDMVLVGSLSLLARLVQLWVPGPVLDVGGALAEHLLLVGPDPEREALIRAVVTGAGAEPAVRRELLVAYGTEAVSGAALECASVLTQALANRHGVLPTSVLADL